MKFYTDDFKISSWKDFIDLTSMIEKRNFWVFRGHSDWNWDLKTTIERAAEDLGIRFDMLPKLEQGMIHKFKRQYAHFSQDKPEDDDYIEWLSIMQHYGSPTRLLDFTYSIYVALFFAVENSRVDQDGAIWGIDSNWLNRKYESIGPPEYKKALSDDK